MRAIEPCDKIGYTGEGGKSSTYSAKLDFDFSNFNVKSREMKRGRFIERLYPSLRFDRNNTMQDTLNTFLEKYEILDSPEYMFFNIRQDTGQQPENVNNINKKIELNGQSYYLIGVSFSNEEHVMVIKFTKDGWRFYDDRVVKGPYNSLKDAFNKLKDQPVSWGPFLGEPDLVMYKKMEQSDYNKKVRNARKVRLGLEIDDEPEPESHAQAAEKLIVMMSELM